jgi:hypothetical protein
MIHYKKEEPLFSIHIPKCGGTSLQEILNNWFGPRLHLHYYDEEQNVMPPKYQISPGICIHGHFNRKRNFGISDYYPEARQFITFIRDPFNILVSRYFDVKKRENRNDAFRNGKKLVLPQSIEVYMEEEIQKEDYHPNIFDYLPGEYTLDNYRQQIEEKFVFVGITEKFEYSINLLSQSLNFKNPAVKRLNRSCRYQKISPKFKKKFMDDHPLEYAFYDYIMETYFSIK